MPELPEVETLCRQLSKVVVGAEILNMQVLDPKLAGTEGFQGRKVLAVNRHGKALQLELEVDYLLFFHFRMTGRLLWHNGGGLPAHVRLVISFPQGRILLIDPRRFATLSVQKKERCSLVGSDPFDDFKPSWLWQISQRTNLPIKPLLMDQSRIAGIGNIYACEILHQTHINPWRRTRDLSLTAWEKVVVVTRSILGKAIACRGTTISDWRDLFGEEGTYQEHLLVYARRGERCLECGGEIQYRKLSGRGTFFCPSCQE